MDRVIGALVGAPNDPPIRPPVLNPPRADAGRADPKLSAKNSPTINKVFRVHFRIFCPSARRLPRRSVARPSLPNIGPLHRFKADGERMS